MQGVNGSFFLDLDPSAGTQLYQPDRTAGRRYTLLAASSIARIYHREFHWCGRCPAAVFRLWEKAKPQLDHPACIRKN
jgi:hypothetical protein